MINPEAHYGNRRSERDAGPGGGHVWPPWSYNPTTGLVYIPSTIGAGLFCGERSQVRPKSDRTGRDGQGRNTTWAIRSSARLRRPPALTPKRTTRRPRRRLDSSLPSIGPQGHGNILVAWDPIAQKERWRGISAGFNQGGTLSSADLVFVSVNYAPHRLSRRQWRAASERCDRPFADRPSDDFHDRWQAIHRDGRQPSEHNHPFGSAPMDSKGQPSRLVVYALDGKAKLPKPASSARSVSGQ